MINSVFDEFWKITHLIVAQWRIIVAAAYCVKSYIFHYETIPPNLRCCHFLKVDNITF